MFFFSVLWAEFERRKIVLGYDIFRCLLHVIMHLKDYAYLSVRKERRISSYFDPICWAIFIVHKRQIASDVINEVFIDALNGVKKSTSSIVNATFYLTKKRDAVKTTFHIIEHSPKKNKTNENFVIHQSIYCDLEIISINN
jgi:hypothetical protein